MLMERKKIVKWENGELHSMRYVGGRNEFGEGGIVLLEAELVVYFRGEYHFNYNHKSIRYERQHFLDLIKQFRFAELSSFAKHGHDIFGHRFIQIILRNDGDESRFSTIIRPINRVH